MRFSTISRNINKIFSLFFLAKPFAIILCQNISHRYSTSVPLGIPLPSRFTHHPDQVRQLGTRATGGAGGNSPVGSDTPVAGWLCLNPSAQWTSIQRCDSFTGESSHLWGPPGCQPRACGPLGASCPLRRSPQAFVSSGRHAESCSRLFLVFSQREWKAASRRWYPHLVRRLLFISVLFSIPPLFQNHLLKLENFVGLKRDLKRDTRD